MSNVGLFVKYDTNTTYLTNILHKSRLRLLQSHEAILSSVNVVWMISLLYVSDGKNIPSVNCLKYPESRLTSLFKEIIESYRLVRHGKEKIEQKKPDRSFQ